MYLVLTSSIKEYHWSQYYRYLIEGNQTPSCFKFNGFLTGLIFNYFFMNSKSNFDFKNSSTSLRLG